MKRLNVSIMKWEVEIKVGRRPKLYFGQKYKKGKRCITSKEGC